MLGAMSEALKPKIGVAAGATVALVLLTAMNFVNYLDRYILPAVQEQVKGEFHLSDSQIGSLTLWFFVAYVLSSPITGWLGDRFPRKPMIVIAALAIAAMNFFTASVHSYMSLNLRHAMLGIGEASFGVFAPALLADYYAESRRNAVLTIFNVAIPCGAALGYLAGGVIGHSYGWRMAFIASAIPGAVIALLILFFMREPYPEFAFPMEGNDPGTEPARLSIQPAERLSRGMIFIKWLLAIPHYIALLLLGIVVYVFIIIGFFAVLITGAWPAGMRNFIVGYMRWTMRVNAYVYLLTDRYPAFSLA